MKATPLYKWYVEMYLATKDLPEPEWAFLRLHNKKRSVNHDTAFKKFRMLQAAYELFATPEMAEQARKENISNKIRKFSNIDDFSDFMLEAEYHEGERIEWEGTVYKLDGIKDFIREYSYDTWMQMVTDIKSLTENGLLVEQR